jgi:phospholipid transport system substrate-binding protein
MGKIRILSGGRIIVLATLLFFVTNPVFATEITDNLKGTIDEVISIVTDESVQDKKVRRQKLRQIIEKQFHYPLMVRSSLGKKSWSKRTPEEKAEFIELFKKLLESSYASKLESYSDEKINYLAEEIRGKFAKVKTEIVRKDATIPVDYKFYNDNGKWLVIDFSIAEVSMVKNYNAQFKKIIYKESYEALVQKLAKKVKELENGNGDNANNETL